jgi:energy-coupling factor transporter transmembrane protein EcfT
MYASYKGKKVTQLIIVSFAVFVAFIILFIKKASVFSFIPYCLVEILALYFLLNFNYVINNQFFEIKYGFIKTYKIPIQQIRKLIVLDRKKGQPANSLHQIVFVSSSNQKKIISPVEAIGFIENMKRLNPKIEIE